MSSPILYLGDTSLQSAATYLAGVMTACDLRYDYVPSDEAVSVEMASQPRKLFIISDYPSKLMSPAAQEAALKQVTDGAGLLMIGGWESFHGLGGDWDTTAIARGLPVEISRADDRVNCDQPALILKHAEHPILANLPWDTRPPTIGGFNAVSPRPGTKTLLQAQRFSAIAKGGQFAFSPIAQHPLLVIGTHGKGRTAALMTDLAPHWVGGFVDWGDGQRVKSTAAGSGEIEVGNLYARFIAQLLAWTGGLTTTARFE